MKDSSARGAVAEHIATAHLLALGYSVYQPLDASSKHDLLICKKGDYLKVQVKRASWLSESRSTTRLRVNTSRVYKGKSLFYEDGDFDLLAAVDGYRMWLLPWVVCQGKYSLCLDYRGSPKYRKREGSFDASRYLVTLPE